MQRNLQREKEDEKAILQDLGVLWSDRFGSEENIGCRCEVLGLF